MQYLSLLQVTGDGKEWAFVNEETSIELSFPSSGTPFLPHEQLISSCQLTDPLNEQVPCTITPTQPGVCSVMYTPTMRGPHQLRIKIKEIDIQGSPFKVNVLPKAVKGAARHTITDVEYLQSVAVSKSGDVVVCHDMRIQETFSLHRHISVFNKKGEKKQSFDPDVECSYAVFTADDNHILAIKGYHKIVKYTIEGRLLISVDCSMPPEFRSPSCIAVHPSDKVIVASRSSSSIRVLNPDLTHSHIFSIHCHDDFLGSLHVACDGNGIVYVAGYSCIRSYNIDGKWISKYSYNFTLGMSIGGICIDSTNTLYVSNGYKNCISVYSNSRKFIKCFNLDGDKHKPLSKIAVDNTTGALYVCDYRNNSVVVY